MASDSEISPRHETPRFSRRYTGTDNNENFNYFHFEATITMPTELYYSRKSRNTSSLTLQHQIEASVKSVLWPPYLPPLQANFSLATQLSCLNR